MGVYIFTWEKLRQYLTEDEADKNSSNDFGKNIIPNMITDGLRVFAYDFEGYWKDVGTIRSLWAANMDVLGKEPLLNLREPKTRIYSRNYPHPCSYIAPEADIVDSYVADGSQVYGKVHHSIIATGCVVEKDAEVYDSIVMPNAVIERSAILRYAIIGENAVVHANAKIGGNPEFFEKNKWDIAVVGKDKVVSQNEVVLPKEVR